MAAVKEAIKNVLPGSGGNQAAWLDEKGARLRVGPADTPKPEPDQILVRNHAVAINPVDWKVQDYGFAVKQWPAVLGTDIAGEVVEVGSNVTQFKKGDRVLSHVHGLGSPDPGDAGFNLYTAAPAINAAIIPDKISYTEASVLPLAIDTAAHALVESHEKGFLGLGYPSLNPSQSGKTLLVWGGSSSVGALTIQLAVATGAKVVTTASKRNHEFVKSLGATTAIDYNDPNIVEDVEKAVKAVGGDFVGIYDAISNADSYKFTVPLLEKLGGNIAVVLGPPENVPAGSKVGSVYAIQPQLLAPVWTDYVTQALESGKLKAVPEALIVGKGLSFVQAGLDANKAGLSARKAVVEL